MGLRKADQNVQISTSATLNIRDEVREKDRNGRATAIVTVTDFELCNYSKPRLHWPIDISTGLHTLVLGLISITGLVTTLRTTCILWCQFFPTCVGGAVRPYTPYRTAGRQSLAGSVLKTMLPREAKANKNGHEIQPHIHWQALSKKQCRQVKYNLMR